MRHNIWHRQGRPARIGLPGPIDRRRQAVGLMGGSFNPAHDGHRHLALLALHKLGLDEVWWLVAPQNPLKPNDGMAPFAERLAGARQVARHPRLKPSDIEARLGTRYTADTLRALQRRFPTRRFVWIMGADCLAEFARWKDWQKIFRIMPVAVFDRPSYSLRALWSLAARHFARVRLKSGSARRLARRQPPAWVFLHTRLHPASATQIRGDANQDRHSAGKPLGQESGG
ncbi:nicotinate-nucleotide adenylyltransferase [Oceanibaculum indicum]|uniref:Probable nicotinate-nucleotide adenylyltransferase n=1 Tax=Oceanibaculum indicum TaxID=526216 RepID=A0A420WR01_9PROT|nr:nicotinate-nucleotide adenylyltransferase [Oceanibaculum indicum]